MEDGQEKILWFDAYASGVIKFLIIPWQNAICQWATGTYTIFTVAKKYLPKIPYQPLRGWNLCCTRTAKRNLNYNKIFFCFVGSLVIYIQQQQHYHEMDSKKWCCRAKIEHMHPASVYAKSKKCWWKKCCLLEICFALSFYLPEFACKLRLKCSYMGATV